MKVGRYQPAWYYINGDGNLKLTETGNRSRDRYTVR